jgi:V-type H+-transporting ATPase subunit d
LIITINSFGTELSKDDRVKLYPTCGRLHPDGLAALARADDFEQVRGIAEYYAVIDIVLFPNDSDYDLSGCVGV